MNNDQIKGRAEQLAGKTKKVVGKVLHNDSLKQKGNVDEVAGKTRATYGDMKNDAKKESDKE